MHIICRSLTRCSPSDFNEHVTLKCGKKVFKFNKHKLVEDSGYFRACLNNSTFVEGRTSVIEFDDIEPELLDTYLQIVDVTDTCDPIDVEHFLVSSEWDNEAMDDIIPMIEMYRLSDRFINKSMRVKLSQSILEYMQKGTVAKVNKSSPEGIKWLFNTYKTAYDTLDPSIPDEANLQSQIAEICCRQIGIDKTCALIHTSPESEAFLEAVLMAATQLVSTLLEQNKSLGVKVKRVKLENRKLRKFIRHMDEEAYRDWLANCDGMDLDGYSFPGDLDDDVWFVANGGYEDEDDEDEEEDDEDDVEDDLHQADH